MEHVLLILVLLGDPSGEALAKGVAAELVRRGGQQVQVVVGPEAKAAIEKQGVTIKDLLITPNIGAHFTAAQAGKPPAPIILYIDRRDAGGDAVVETRAWFDGRAERHVAIAGSADGKSTDPLPAVTAGVIGLIGHRLPGNAQAAKPGVVDEVRLAQLAEHRQWLDLLGLLAGVTDKTPRQRYYEVLAYAKLGQRDPAVEALNQLRTSFPGHFLVAAAEELIPSATGAPKANEADQGGNELRDGAKPADDDSNVLK